MQHIIEKFAQVAAQPLEYAKQWKAANGKRVIGSFPMHFPAELAHAADALPILLQESPDQITVGHGKVFSFYCGYTRSIIDQSVKGDFNFLDAIMFGDHCVQLLGAADVIRYQWPDTRILFNQLISSMSAPWAFEQSLEAFRALKAELEELIEREIPDAAIWGSIRLFNRNRQLIRRVYDLRRARRIAISARQMQTIVKSSMVMDKAAHTALLEELLATIEERPLAPAGIRVFLSGHMCHPPKPEILDLIEECGATVIADDLYHGYRYIATDIAEGNGDPLEAMADWYLLRNKRVPCPTRVDQGADWDAYLVNAVEEDSIEGVIVLMAKFCEPHMYYYPEIKEAFECRGIPHLLVETEHESMPLEALKTRFETFLEVVKRRVAA